MLYFPSFFKKKRKAGFCSIRLCLPVLVFQSSIHKHFCLYRNGNFGWGVGNAITKTLLLTVLNGLSKTTPVFSDVPNGKWVSQFSDDEALERGLRCFVCFWWWVQCSAHYVQADCQRMSGSSGVPSQWSQDAGEKWQIFYLNVLLQESYFQIRVCVISVPLFNTNCLSCMSGRYHCVCAAHRHIYTILLSVWLRQMQEVTDGLMVLPRCHRIAAGNSINMQSEHDVCYYSSFVFRTILENQWVSYGSRSAVKIHMLLLWVVQVLFHSLALAMEFWTWTPPLELAKSQCFSFFSRFFFQFTRKKKEKKKFCFVVNSPWVPKHCCSGTWSILQLPLQVLGGIHTCVTFCASAVPGFSEIQPVKGVPTNVPFLMWHFVKKSSLLTLHARVQSSCRMCPCIFLASRLWAVCTALCFLLVPFLVPSFQFPVLPSFSYRTPSTAFSCLW